MSRDIYKVFGSYENIQDTVLVGNLYGNVSMSKRYIQGTTTVLIVCVCVFVCVCACVCVCFDDKKPSQCSKLVYIVVQTVSIQ